MYHQASSAKTVRSPDLNSTWPTWCCVFWLLVIACRSLRTSLTIDAAGAGWVPGGGGAAGGVAGGCAGAVEGVGGCAAGGCAPARTEQRHTASASGRIRERSVKISKIS